MANNDSARIFRVLATLMASASLLACNTAARMAPDYPPHFALVYPKETAASAVTELNGKRSFKLSGVPVGVPAGVHRIEVTTCPEGSTARCAPRLYPLNLLAGRTYIIRGAHLVEVFDRTKLAAGRIDTLRWNGSAYIDEREQADERQRDRAKVSKEAQIRTPQSEPVDDPTLDLNDPSNWPWEQ